MTWVAYRKPDALYVSEVIRDRNVYLLDIIPSNYWLMKKENQFSNRWIDLH